MDYGARYQLAVFGIIVILIVTVSFISSHPVFADSYEKSQIISQTNECGNYWFPVNIICSNLNSQAQGEENDDVSSDEARGQQHETQSNPF